MMYEQNFIDLKKWSEEFDEKILFCSGALGDFFLGLDFALKYKYPLIYWSKRETFDISKKFLNIFNLKNHVINVGAEIWKDQNTNFLCKEIEKLLKNRGVRTHLNNKCDLPTVEWLPYTINTEYFDFHQYKLNTPKKYCLVCPSGGNSNPKILRFFYLEEFSKLLTAIEKLGIEPIIVGNDNQLKKFDRNKKYKWIQFEKFENEKIEIKHFIECVKSSMFVVSPDTSIKTLSAAMYVPTIVLKNRNTENQYITGPWDRIFLDKHKWKTLECLPFESIMRKFDKSFNLKMI